MKEKSVDSLIRYKLLAVRSFGSITAMCAEAVTGLILNCHIAGLLGERLPLTISMTDSGGQPRNSAEFTFPLIAIRLCNAFASPTK